jgi:hypothetical protein
MHDPRIALRRLRINGLQLVEQTAADGNLSRVSELWESCFSTRHGFWSGALGMGTNQKVLVGG